ncbi:MAG: site-2 protease family protein [Candidatus Magnetobacterium sp. LHC-1]|uniref:Site-2 protease family protein n=1 Tax=Candidatus Magnetobacterium casense TaxID=1455061 RepID=A0ABS6S0L1_9BACT|nr:site-2 protease family protein [Candidatus Magnetobacterium casensis]MBF0608722.1 site-2 protease family protein [Nitrospirota bacterium]MBV6342388.1 site-2 protease family protein [Candidatus Magnetobacterium casensis]
MDIVQILRSLSVAALPILIAITFHEVAHGWVADKRGDPTAKEMGRLTLNPIAHIDLMGTIIMPIMLFILSSGSFIFGSAKPVPVNFGRLKNPRVDAALVSAAGPGANIVIATVSIVLIAVIARLYPSTHEADSMFSKVLIPVEQMLRYSVYFNVFLAAFNLIPIPPLDGGRIVVSLLPYRQAYQYSRIEPYGILIVLALWVTGMAQYIITPIQKVVQFLIGMILMPLGRIL